MNVYIKEIVVATFNDSTDHVQGIGDAIHNQAKLENVDLTARNDNADTLLDTIIYDAVESYQSGADWFLDWETSNLFVGLDGINCQQFLWSIFGGNSPLGEPINPE